MRLLSLFVLVVWCAGCIPIGASIDRDLLIKKPIRQWSEAECEMFLLEEMPTNFLASDQALQAVVFPCTPQMLLAYNWRKRQMHLITDDEFVQNTDRQARNCIGAFFDGEKDKFVDQNGRYIRSIDQLDSLMVIIRLESNVKGVDLYLKSMFRTGGAQSIKAAAVSNYLGMSSSLETFSNVSGLLSRMAIKGNNEHLASPMYVRRDAGGYLMDEGSFLAMFPITTELKGYLHQHKTVDLAIDLGDRTISMPLHLAE